MLIWPEISLGSSAPLIDARVRDSWMFALIFSTNGNMALSKSSASCSGGMDISNLLSSLQLVRGIFVPVEPAFAKSTISVEDAWPNTKLNHAEFLGRITRISVEQT